MNASVDNTILFNNVESQPENIIYSNIDGTISINDDKVKFAIIVSRIRLTASSNIDYSFILKKNDDEIVAHNVGQISSWSKANFFAVIPVEKNDKLFLTINPSVETTIQGAGGLAGIWANAEFLFLSDTNQIDEEQEPINPDDNSILEIIDNIVPKNKVVAENNVSINDALEYKLFNINVSPKNEITQETSPSPENPCEIKNVKPITNLFDINMDLKKITGVSNIEKINNSIRLYLNNGNTGCYAIYPLGKYSNWLNKKIFFKAKILNNTSRNSGFGLWTYDDENFTVGFNELKMENLIVKNGSFDFTFIFDNEDLKDKYAGLVFYPKMNQQSSTTDDYCEFSNIIISESNSGYVPYGNWLKCVVRGSNLLCLSEENLRTKTPGNFTYNIIDNNSISIINQTNVWYAGITFNFYPKETGKYYFGGIVSELNSPSDNVSITFSIYPKGSSERESYKEFTINKDEINNFKTSSINIDDLNKDFVFTIYANRNVGGDGSTEYKSVFKNLFVSKDNEYEPYKEKTYFYDMSIYDDEGNIVSCHELSKKNDVKDDLDLISSALNKKIGKYVFNGNESIEARTSNNEGYFVYVILENIMNNMIPYKLKDNVPCVCTHFTYGGTVVGANPVYNSKDICFYLYYNSNFMTHAMYFNTTIPTLDEFKTFLKNQYNAGTPITIYYELETPETINLNRVLKVETFKGYNNIFIETTEETINEVEYALDLKKYIDKLHNTDEVSE